MDGAVFGITLLQQLAAVVGYLAGSIPFGLVLTRIAGQGDIRRIGSGNIGATNVLRTGNKRLAALTLLLDGGKGAAAALVMGLWGRELALIAGLFAVIGHDFPVWLKFQGGKGVATTLGVVLALDPVAGIVACAAWLLVALVLRISSLSALVALVVAPAVLVVRGDEPAAVIAVILAVLGYLRHHQNIRRLLNGTEPRIGAGKRTDEGERQAE